MIDRPFMYLMFFLGFGAGLAVAYIFMYLPVRYWARQTAQNKADINRTLGVVRAAANTNLADAVGAFQQARAAYIPIYPGNSGRADDPDPAWLTWLAEQGLDYWTRRSPVKLRWRTAAMLVALTVLWKLGRRRYPWWQRIADRVWEATTGVRHELSVRWKVLRSVLTYRWSLLVVSVTGPPDPAPRVYRVKRSYPSRGVQWPS